MRSNSLPLPADSYDSKVRVLKVRAQDLYCAGCFADSYDSMTRPHTQRPAMQPAHAAAEIERCSGTQFDPHVVGALGEVLINAGEEQHCAA